MMTTNPSPGFVRCSTDSEYDERGHGGRDWLRLHEEMGMICVDSSDVVLEFTRVSAGSAVFLSTSMSCCVVSWTSVSAHYRAVCSVTWEEGGWNCGGVAKARGRGGSCLIWYSPED